MKACLVVTCTIPDNLRKEIAAGRYPRTEFYELADRLESEIIDFSYVEKSRSLVVQLGTKLIGKQMGLALSVFLRRKQFDVIYFGSETAGLFLAVMLKFIRRRPRIAILSHYLSNPKKAVVFRAANLQSHIDLFITLNDRQTDFLTNEVRLPSTSYHHILYGANVDGSFFDPLLARPITGRYIFSVGRERRDYDTLIEAVGGTDVHTKIISSGMRDMGDYKGEALSCSHIPPNVELVEHVPFPVLRDLYGSSAFHVMPVLDFDYPAGITAIIESMAMGKPVIATHSHGIQEYIEHGVTGFWTKSGDPKELREKILYLWNNPEVTEKMGKAAREWVLDRVDLGAYSDRMVSLLRNLK